MLEVLENKMLRAVMEDDIAYVRVNMTEELLHMRISNFGFQNLLMVASNFGSKKSVRFLIDRGIDVNLQSGNNASDIDGGTTALHFAAYCGYYSIVVLLLKHGADVNALNGEYETPLTFAMESWNLNFRIIELFLRAGAGLRLLNQDIRTLFEAAISRGEIRLANEISESEPISPQMLDEIISAELR